MIVDRIYKISAFGDFSDIIPTPDNMMFFIETFKDDELIPSVFQELRVDNGNSQPKTFQRIALVSTDGKENIPIATNRIDYEIKTTADVALTQQELKEYQEKIVKVLGTIFDKFDKRASRLALNTENLIVGLTSEEVDDFLGRFSNPISIYEKTSLDEWNTRMMIRKEDAINENNETFNIITTIAKTDLRKTVDNALVESKGFSISGDINTIAEKTIHRFSARDFAPFIDKVTAWWCGIISELS